MRDCEKTNLFGHCALNVNSANDQCGTALRIVAGWPPLSWIVGNMRKKECQNFPLIACQSSSHFSVLLVPTGDCFNPSVSEFALLGIGGGFEHYAVNISNTFDQQFRKTTIRSERAKGCIM